MSPEAQLRAQRAFNRAVALRLELLRAARPTPNAQRVAETLRRVLEKRV